MFAHKNASAWEEIREYLTPDEQARVARTCKGAREILGRAQLPHVLGENYAKLKRFYLDDRGNPRRHEHELTWYIDRQKFAFEINRVALYSRAPGLIRYIVHDMNEWEMLLADALIARDIQICDYIVRLLIHYKYPIEEEVAHLSDGELAILKKYNISADVYDLCNLVNNMRRVAAGDLITSDLVEEDNYSGWRNDNTTPIANYYGYGFVRACYLLAAMNKCEAGIKSALRCFYGPRHHHLPRYCQIDTIIESRKWPADVREFLARMRQL